MPRADLLPNCPPDRSEVADRYCLGRLSAEEQSAFEDHYSRCDACAEEIARTLALMEALAASRA